jgi:hypothetical protein
MHAKKKKDKNSPPQDKTSTFKETREYVINLVWRRLPKWLRITIAAVVILVTPIIATESYWYPTVSKLIFPIEERINFRGYVYENQGKPLQIEVQILNEKDSVLIWKRSDKDGFVTFNISKSPEPKIIRCLFPNRKQSYDFNRKAVNEGKKFEIMMIENSIEWK